MKYKSFLSLIIILFGLQGQAQVKYTIYGEFGDGALSKGAISNGDKVKIKYGSSGKVKEAIVQNGKFVITDTLSEPTSGMLDLKRAGNNIFLDNSVYYIRIDTVKVGPNAYAYKTNITTKSPSHNLYINFMNEKSSLMTSKANLLKEIDQAPNSMAASDLKKRVQSIDEKINNNYHILALQHPNNVAVAYVLPGAPDFAYDTYIGVFKTLTHSVKNNYWGKRLEDRLNSFKNLGSETQVSPYTYGRDLRGTKLPSIQAIDINCKARKLEQAVSENKYTLIDFWASWCKPCREFNTNLKAKQEQYTKLGLGLVSFSLDPDASSWKKAVQQDGLKWLQLSDLKAEDSYLVKYLGIYAIPSNILVDSKGIIISRDIQQEQIAPFLEGLEGKH
jgi:thiol-disulfide isomerase/thioredoxin